MALMALMIAAGAATLMSPTTLQHQVEAFAGQPALVDPRLLLPACGRPDLGWAPGGRSVAVHCAAPEWRVFVPVAGARVVEAPPPPVTAVSMVPAIRRGDRVSLEVTGAGFVIALDGVADADAKDGRVAVRPVAGGRRLNGTIDADGRVRLH